eukprot:6456207-Amphidinium_carterae.1
MCFQAWVEIFATCVGMPTDIDAQSVFVGETLVKYPLYINTEPHDVPAEDQAVYMAGLKLVAKTSDKQAEFQMRVSTNPQINGGKK